MSSNWAKDYIKYSNETGGGSKGGSGGGSGPGCGSIITGIILIYLIVSVLSRM